MTRPNLFPLFVLAFLVVGLPATAGLLWLRSQPADEPPVLAQPATRTIVLKTVATGSVVPRDEVAVKPRVSGIVETLHVEEGDLVAAGDLIADIRVLPNSAQLASARSAVREAEIRRRDATTERDRVLALAEQGAASATERQQVETTFALRTQELQAAQTDLVIVREGAARGAGQVSTRVVATVSGMVLTVPVKEGASVIEANTFNEGTTVAELADMTDLIFEGMLDESEVGRVSEGMPLSVVIAAWPDDILPGTLEHISPKGEDVSGAIQFGIRAALDLSTVGDRFVRAGLSANADIVLDQRTDVLTISESLLRFEDGQPLVEVETGEAFEARPVTLGLSDGIHVEVIQGVRPSDTLRRPRG